MIALSAAHFPLVLLDLGGADRTEDDFRRMFASLRELSQRACTSHGLVAMTRQVPDARERRVIADEANRFGFGKDASAVVLVAPDKVLRGAVIALCWLMPRHASRIEVAPTSDGAVERVSARLRALGISVTGEQASDAAQWLRERRESRSSRRLA